MPAYFGYTSIGANSVNNANRTMRPSAYTAGMVCPGSGSFTVTELSAYVGLGTLGNIRLALSIPSDNSLVCQGNSEVAVTTGPSWQGHMGSGAITPNPCTITGGVSYEISFTKDGGTGTYEYYDTGSNWDDWAYGARDDTGGFPDPLTTLGNGEQRLYSVRCGVDQAGGSAAITGTATASITEAHVVAGGKTIIITLTGDTFIAA